MAKKNPHIGSSFESWLDEAGIREEVTAAAIKAVIARQLASEMKKQGITKPKMAELMKNQPRANRPLARSGQRQRDD
jgi:antitoxin HicB